MTNTQIPRVAVGALVLNGDRALLVQRKNPPAAGKWAIPGGKVEWGEPMAETARREVLEETGIDIETGEIIYTFDRIVRDETGEITFHYVIIDYLAVPVDPTAEPVPADDALAAKWVSAAEMESLPTTRATRDLVLRELEKTLDKPGG